MKILITILLLTFSAYTQSVTAPTITATANDKVTVSITGDGTNVTSFQFVIFFDDDALIPTGDVNNYFGCSSGNTGLIILCNVTDPGTFRVVGYGAYGFSGPATLVDIPFTTVKGDSDLDIEDVYMFQNNILVHSEVTDGFITLE